jgi:uncharacterized membrane protein
MREFIVFGKYEEFSCFPNAGRRRMDRITDALLLLEALGCGLMAGLYFAFSAFVMSALGRIEPAAGIAAMNSINRVILRSTFMPLFFGTTVLALVLGILAALQWEGPRSASILAGAVLYLGGMFACTMAFNVPLNNALQGAGPEQGRVWERYLRDWTRWNHVRTVASLVATALFVIALAYR